MKRCALLLVLVLAMSAQAGTLADMRAKFRYAITDTHPPYAVPDSVVLSMLGSAIEDVSEISLLFLKVDTIPLHPDTMIYALTRELIHFQSAFLITTESGGVEGIPYIDAGDIWKKGYDEDGFSYAGQNILVTQKTAQSYELVVLYTAKADVPADTVTECDLPDGAENAAVYFAVASWLNATRIPANIQSAALWEGRGKAILGPAATVRQSTPTDSGAIIR